MRSIKGLWLAAVMIAALTVPIAARAQEDYKKLPFWDTSLPIETRVQDLVSRLTLEEKILQVYAEAPEVPRIGLKAYTYGNEALHGILGPGKFTVFPMAVALGSTWDPDLIHEITTAISDEAWGAINRDGKYPGERLRTFWSPTINMARDPRWGRTPETYGEDPYLTGRIALAYVKGFQGNDPKYIKCGSTPKHFVANNEDHNRDRCNVVVSERTLREYYLPAYKVCVQEGNAQSIMGAYNAINGVPCNANKWLLTDILRNEWGFTGYVSTDCGAPENLYTKHQYAKDGVEAAAFSITSGADVECGGKKVFPTYMMDAYKKGLVTEADLDRALSNLFRVRMRLGMFDPPEMVPFTKISPDVIGSKEHVNLSRKAAGESMVLLKNDPVDGAALLPINSGRVKTIAVVGFNTDVALYGDYSGTSPNEPVTPIQGIKARAGDKIKILTAKWYDVPDEASFTVVPGTALNSGSDIGLKAEYFSGSDLDGKPAASLIVKSIGMRSDSVPEELKSAAAISARWTGTIKSEATGLHHFIVKTPNAFRLYIDDRLILDKKADVKEKKKAAFEKGKVLDTYSVEKTKPRLPMASAMLEAGRKHEVKIEYISAKGAGAMQFLWAPPSKEQEKDRAAEYETIKNADLVLAIIGYRLEDEHESIDRQSLDLPRGHSEYVMAATALNRKTAVLLTGGSPVTINWIAANSPAILETWYGGEQGGNALADLLFGDISPAGRLPFTFYASMDDLPPFDDYEISRGRTYMYYKKEPIYPFGYGLSYTLFEYSNMNLDRKTAGPGDIVNVSVTVKNSGYHDGDEVVQLYVADSTGPKRPIKRLKGFKRISLKEGASKVVTIPVAVKDLAYWDETAKDFVVVPGEYEIQIGSSSADIRRSDTITVAK